MKKGLTLIEMLVVVIIFSILFVAVFAVLLNSNTSWRVGYNRTVEQQEARRVMEFITRLLRSSNPAWNVTIAADVDVNHDKILFYEPDFNNTTFNNTTGEVNLPPGPWVIFKSNAGNANETIMKIEGGNWVTIAQHIKRIKFSGGDCSGCNCNFVNPGCAGCVNVTNNCPIVRIEINATREKGFLLTSYVTLRNNDHNTTQGSPPQEGEF